MFCCLYFCYKLFFKNKFTQEKEIPLIETPKEKISNSLDNNLILKGKSVNTDTIINYL